MTFCGIVMVCVTAVVLVVVMGIGVSGRMRNSTCTAESGLDLGILKDVLNMLAAPAGFCSIPSQFMKPFLVLVASAFGKFQKVSNVGFSVLVCLHDGFWMALDDVVLLIIAENTRLSVPAIDVAGKPVVNVSVDLPFAAVEVGLSYPGMTSVTFAISMPATIFHTGEENLVLNPIVFGL